MLNQVLTALCACVALSAMRSMASRVSWTVARGEILDDSVNAIAADVLLLGAAGEFPLR